MSRLDDAIAEFLGTLPQSRPGPSWGQDDLGEVEPGTCPPMSDAEVSAMFLEMGVRGPTLAEQVASCRRYGLRLVNSDGRVVYQPG